MRAFGVFKVAVLSTLCGGVAVILGTLIATAQVPPTDTTGDPQPTLYVEVGSGTGPSYEECEDAAVWLFVDGEPWHCVERKDLSRHNAAKIELSRRVVCGDPRASRD